MTALSKAGRTGAHLAIRTYQLTVSGLVGRQCRYLPTCSDYADEAIRRHGLWAGGWIGAARICRCHPWGGSGFDPVPAEAVDRSNLLRPWHYGQWKAPDALRQDRARSVADSA